MGILFEKSVHACNPWTPFFPLFF